MDDLVLWTEVPPNLNPATGLSEANLAKHFPYAFFNIVQRFPFISHFGKICHQHSVFTVYVFVLLFLYLPFYNKLKKMLSMKYSDTSANEDNSFRNHIRLPKRDFPQVSIENRSIRSGCCPLFKDKFYKIVKSTL